MPLNNVPLAGQSLNDTRIPINQNFAVIDTAFSVDHQGYNLANQGFHNKLSMPVQAVAPATIAGGTLLYTQTSTFTGQPELVFAHQTGTTAPVGARINEFTSAGWANPGWTRLPSGILLKWGQFAATGNAFTTLVFPVAANIPVFSSIFTVLVTAGTPTSNSYNQSVMLNTTNITTANFQVFNRQIIGFATASSQVTYLAIGV